MYKLRTGFPTNEERARQHKIQRIIFGATPVSRFEKLVVAVLNTPYVNSTRSHKLEKCGEAIMDILETNDLTDDAAIFAKRRSIIQLVNDTKFKIGDVFQLACKYKIQTLYPEPTKPNFIKWSLVPKIRVTLTEFERLMFDNRTIIRYYENIKFIDYIVENLKYYLGIDSVEQSADNLLWQARLLQLIDQTNYNEFTLIKAFYENRVVYENVIYDASFVPKYPVTELKHQALPLVDNHNYDDINYWNSIDLSTINKVPIRHLAIFMVFPFKNGFYVQPNGNIIKIPLRPKRRTSLINTIDSICAMDDLEVVLDQTSRLYTVDDVLNWTIYEKTLKNVGIGILILRRYYGNILALNPYKIALPNEYNVLSWLALQCRKADTNPGVLLPLSDKAASLQQQPQLGAMTRSAEITLNLIRDIVATAQTPFGAAQLCSNYCILEIDMYPIYRQLKTPTEKYIFLMLVFQYYPYYTYYKALKSIKETLIFGTDTTVDVLRLYPQSVRHYSNLSIADKLSKSTLPIVCPQDMNASVNECNPSVCPDLYEFTDLQLNELAKFGTTTFKTPKQFANYIDVCI